MYLYRILTRRPLPPKSNNMGCIYSQLTLPLYPFLSRLVACQPLPPKGNNMAGIYSHIYSRHWASSRCLIYSLIICSYIWLVCGGPHQPTTNNIVLIFICLVKGFYCTISYFLFNKLRLSLKLHISAFKTCLGVSLTFVQARL